MKVDGATWAGISSWQCSCGRNSAEWPSECEKTHLFVKARLDGNSAEFLPELRWPVHVALLSFINLVLLACFTVSYYPCML